MCTCWAFAPEQPPSNFHLLFFLPFFSAFPRFTRFWVNWVSTGSFAGASFSLFFYPVKLIGFVRFNCWQGNAGKLFMRIGANFNVCRLTIRYGRSPKIVFDPRNTLDWTAETDLFIHRYHLFKQLFMIPRALRWARWWNFNPSKDKRP